MKAIGSVAAIALALALQTTLDQYLSWGFAAVDLVLVAVVAIALMYGPVAGMLAGSFGGLVQDALATPIVGIGGLAKAVVGFFAGAFAQQFIVTAALPRLMTLLAGTVVHAAVFMGLYAVLDIRTFASPWRTVAGQALGNAVVGLIALMVVDAVPGVVERRRLARRSRH